MRIEKSEVMKKEYKTKYIADDGTEFDSLAECNKYEHECKMQELGIKIRQGWEFYESLSGTMFYIPSEDAFRYFVNKACLIAHRYYGSGWYMRIWPNNDYGPQEELLYMTDYLRQIEEEYLEYKNSMYAIMLSANEEK